MFSFVTEVVAVSLPSYAIDIGASLIELGNTYCDGILGCETTLRSSPLWQRGRNAKSRALFV